MLFCYISSYNFINTFSCLFIPSRRQIGSIKSKFCVGPHMTPGKIYDVEKSF